MKNKVTLYIAEHNTTGKKYFGKTFRYFTEEDLQKHYHGSGPNWKKYLKKYGDNVTMSIYGIFSLNENDSNYVEPIALQFSKDNNITYSEEWANRIPENGLDGIGPNVTDEFRQNMSKIRKNRPTCINIKTGTYTTVDKEIFDKCDYLKGVNYNKINKSNNPNAKILYVYNEKDELKYTFNGNRTECEQYNLTFYIITVSAKKQGEPIGYTKQARTELRKNMRQNYIGWYALYDGETRKTFNIDFNINDEQSIGVYCELKNKYFGISNNGSNNPNALRINIYDNNDVLRFKCHGNIDYIIEKYNLPPRIKDTYRNGKPLYWNLKNSNRLKNKEFWNYKDWYAVKQV